MSAVSYHKKSINVDMTVRNSDYWDFNHVYEVEVTKKWYEHEAEAVRVNINYGISGNLLIENDQI